MSQSKNNQSIEIDKDLVRELELYSQNTGNIYTIIHIPYVKNYRKRLAKGIYKEDLAIKGILNNYVPLVVQSYNKEIAPVNPTKADKIALAKELLQNVLNDIKEGV